ncbi:hypothetical protein GCM10027590_38730 [Nocardiopsis nanhaiensis]
MAFGEAGDQTGERLDGLGGQRGHVHAAPSKPLDGLHRRPGQIESAYRLACGADEGVSSVAEYDAAADAVEEVTSQVSFQGADRL